MRHVIHRPAVRRQAHPLENWLAVVTIGTGLVAFITGAVHATHLIAVLAGSGGFLIGLYSQLISATTGERWLNVIGMGLAFVGVGLGLAHGGFAV